MRWKTALWKAPAFTLGACAAVVFIWGASSLFGILPWEFQYWNWMDIKSGNAIIANLEQFHREHGRLPDQYNQSEMAALGFEPNAVAYNPLFSAQGSDYEITYVHGFDGPYIVYSSHTKKWRCELC